jgi:cyclopropane fatty-acyl-phospholipid synthase-like methyltransferase
MQLVEPLQLDESKLVVDITAGIGTATRVIAREFGCMVDGLQMDPAQLELAAKFADEAGVGDKVTIREGSLGNCDIEPASRDVVFGRAALLGLKEKDAIFNDIWAMLKPGGQVLLAEFVAKDAGGAKADAAEWAKFEKMQPYLVTVNQIKQGIAASHLDVLQADDVSEEFCSHITHGLAGLTDVLKQGTVPKDQRSWVMWEVELWARRVLMLQGGNIGFYLFHASKPLE